MKLRRPYLIALWCLAFAGLVAWQQLYRAPRELAQRAWHEHASAPQDFLQEWAAARDVLDGRPLYDPLTHAMERYRHDMGLPVPERQPIQPGVPVNGHPPTMALLALPLGPLTYVQAFRLWNVLGFAALGGSVWLIVRTLCPRPLRAFLLVMSILLLGYPLRYQCQQGQLSLLLLVLLTGVWACSRAGRDGWAGALLAVAIAVKLFPALALLYFVLQRRWRAVAATTLTLAALLTATGLVCGWDCYERFVTRGMASVQDWRAAPSNASLSALSAKLFDPGSNSSITPLHQSATLARLLGGLACLLVLVVLARCLRWATTTEERDGAFALTLVAMLLCSPITWAHAFLLLLLPLCWLWQRWQSVPLKQTLLLGLLAVLCLSPEIWQRRWLGDDLGQGTTSWQVLAVFSIQMYALLALFLSGAWELWGRPAPTPHRLRTPAVSLPRWIQSLGAGVNRAAAPCAASPPLP